MKKVTVSSKFFNIFWCRRWEIRCFLLLVLCVGICAIFDDNKDTLGVVRASAAIAILMFLFLCVLLIIHAGVCAMKPTDFEFVFGEHEVLIRGNNSEEEEFKRVINYNMFEKVMLDFSKTLFILTGSERKILEISLEGINNKKVNSILREFQKHGKQILIAPELYGVYSIDGEI